ncbi:hypothetical protein KP509_07G013000 [Ceratopteris richardii]|uniref:Acireductone dioxygenase n=1 Tax=Ceratopteris richardii TaxID=49495 RepID=A0A8T2UCD3_CERRI|nr:hypothetical protein KP509_07G013000 [Ceratopteris richardii]
MRMSNTIHLRKGSDGEHRDLEAWLYRPTDEDRRILEFPAYSSDAVLFKRVRVHFRWHLSTVELGVMHWEIDADNWQTDPTFLRVKSEQGYVFTETITVAPGALDEYEKKTHHFFQEHLHPYEESRLILEGSGYWDIRDYNDDWIRFRVCKGDMVTLPPGMYHRFTVDINDFIKAVLLFKETPTRVDILRPDGDDTQARKEYITNVLDKYNRRL